MTLDLPGEDVLRVVVSQVDFRRTTNRDAFGLAVIRLNEIAH